MIERKIDAYIKQYYDTSDNALVVTGARQIGRNVQK